VKTDNQCQKNPIKLIYRYITSIEIYHELQIVDL